MQHDGVGDLMDTGEFGLGLAPRTSKPINKIELSKAKEEEIAKMQEDDEFEKSGIEEEDESKMEIIRLKKQRDKKRKAIDR